MRFYQTKVTAMRVAVKTYMFEPTSGICKYTIIRYTHDVQVLYLMTRQSPGAVGRKRQRAHYPAKEQELIVYFTVKTNVYQNMIKLIFSLM